MPSQRVVGRAAGGGAGTEAALVRDPAAQSHADIAVCVGMPVYNGAKTLSQVLENLTAQTHRNVTYVISDNGSTDATPAICAEWAARDPRIQVFRQPRTVSPTENFSFVLGKCRAPYFMWAAHDDFRDADYIDKLLAALCARPDAILAFGDVMARYTDGRVAPFRLDFETTGLSPNQRLRRGALSQLHHLYGLWRADALKRVSWRHVDWWHDTPLMMAASQLGEFIHVPGVNFHYTNNKHPFFDWVDTATAGGGHLANVWRRARDLVLLVCLSAWTVGQVAGPVRGVVAGFWVLVKVIQQIGGFLWRRRPGRSAAGAVEH